MSKTDAADQWLSDIDLATVFEMLRSNGVSEVLYKVLPQNANSKNQVYLAPDLSQLAKIPSGEVTLHRSSSRKIGGENAVFRAALDFYWVGRSGQLCPAPNANLIFYPQYPEVRFSGFLKGCKSAPSSLYAKEKRGQEPDRILVFGLGNGRKVVSITLPPEAPAAKEIRATEPHESYGALHVLPIAGKEEANGFLELMLRLCRIHRHEWHPSTRLNPKGELVPCRASNCNGNTLESLLDIRSNGYSVPDFRGWEVKTRNVPNSERPGSSTVTLFTPEPTSGDYVSEHFEEFMRRYAYPDQLGRADRVNFGGQYRAFAKPHALTGLRLVLDGFDHETKRYDLGGAIRLLDCHDNEAMGWTFAKLMDHWKVKHAQAAYVPSESRFAPTLQYRFGKNILIGEGAEFGLFLLAVHEGKLYYDPGIKLEGVSTAKPRAKKRSQFRVRSKDLATLYLSSRIVDACEESAC